MAENSTQSKIPRCWQKTQLRIYALKYCNYKMDGQHNDKKNKGEKDNEKGRQRTTQKTKDQTTQSYV
jgi:hypothetical protein